MQEMGTNEKTEAQLYKCMAKEKDDTALQKVLRILGGPFAYSDIWEYRKFFMTIEDETVRNTRAYNAVMPETKEQWMQGMDSVIAAYPEGIRTHHVTLGRPTLYNGIWCIEKFG